MHVHKLRKKKYSNTLSRKLLAAICVLAVLSSVTHATCFGSTRLPKVLATPGDQTLQTSAEAITTHNGTSAIFVGGHLNEPAFLTGLSVSVTAHIGRISTVDQMWYWSKQFWEETNDKMSTVTALAVNPAGTKLACHG